MSLALRSRLATLGPRGLTRPFNFIHVRKLTSCCPRLQVHPDAREREDIQADKLVEQFYSGAPDPVTGGTFRRSNTRPIVRKYESKKTALNPDQDFPDAEPPQAIGSRESRRKAKAYESTPIAISIDGQPCEFSPILLRDLCDCPSCVDPSTKQKLFSTADIPSSIHARAISQTAEGVDIGWIQDVPGYGEGHNTHLDIQTLRDLSTTGMIQASVQSYDPGPQITWDAKAYGELPDIEYDAYMQEDAALLKALRQLHTHGLLFLQNVPESENSVSTIAERIGAVKNTFYGYTWDVRSVPQAKNVAYTSQDLGFHMDLLYMHQPPHLQFLHCIRSSSAGGASLFTDSYKAAVDLYNANLQLFTSLCYSDINFHYDHPSSHLYQQSRPVVELGMMALSGLKFDRVQTFKRFYETGQYGKDGRIGESAPKKPLDILEFLNAVNWSPPFQGSFTLERPPKPSDNSPQNAAQILNKKVNTWYAAAAKFSALVHRPQGIYERLMRPGECVIFDNRRVLHARKAFEVGDEGKERWLRGAYLDKDPYLSKMRVLSRQFQDVDA
ncbi:hypothetical protein LTR37_002677 [Vermiconidia calcicola]|uniref:Uncharacterized protein n=1 Tax=Vermiconidia calcicola TaxID=1690605 RepID=A0ACC3NSD5_9PEZI|nr:hypothetical protein LTR37_002677 [Vermiconidia calcicola]